MRSQGPSPAAGEARQARSGADGGPGATVGHCCAAQTRRLHELSVEVLSSYRLARIESITAGFDLAAAVPVTA